MPQISVVPDEGQLFLSRGPYQVALDERCSENFEPLTSRFG